MINRVLIRTKVVQALYSQMLTESRFKIEPQPDPPTKEKRFAYSLYLDTLAIIVMVAKRLEVRGKGHPLADDRFVLRINIDESVKSRLKKYELQPFDLQPVVEMLTEEVKSSALFKGYIKKSVNERNPAEFWKHVYEIMLRGNHLWSRIVARREDYTLRSVDRYERLMDNTFVNFMSSQENMSAANHELRRSLEKSRELYFRLLWLPVELTDIRERQLENAREKYIVTHADLNPNLRFVENQLVEKIRTNKEIADYINRHKIDMSGDRSQLELLLRDLMQTEIYKEYMSFPATDMETDMRFWRDAMRGFILQSPDFLEMMEDKSVFWNDDIEIESEFVLKTYRKLSDAEDENPVLPMFKDDEDARFGYQLFDDVLKNRDIYRSWIDEVVNTKDWDTERLAFMDVVIMMTALSEIMNFPAIPVSVSMNEYIDLAKSYSSAKSGVFVNGVLGTVLKNLKERDLLTKK